MGSFNLERTREEFNAANKVAKALSDQLSNQVGYLQAETDVIDQAVESDMNAMREQLNTITDQTDKEPE